MKHRDNKLRLKLVVTFAVLFSGYTLTALAVPGSNAPGPEFPEPTDPPIEQDPPAPTPQPNPPDSPNPCLPSVFTPVNWDPTVGHVSEPGMPLGVPLGQGTELSDECVQFLRTKASGENSAVVAVSLRGDGTDATRMTIRDGAPVGTTFVRFANISSDETVGFGAWDQGSQIWHVTVGPNTPQFFNGVLVRRRDAPPDANILPSVPTADTVFFDRPVLWWFDSEAYWSPDTFWKLFDGKQVDFVYVGH